MNSYSIYGVLQSGILLGNFVIWNSVISTSVQMRLIDYSLLVKCCIWMIYIQTEIIHSVPDGAVGGKISRHNVHIFDCPYSIREIWTPVVYRLVKSRNFTSNVSFYLILPKTVRKLSVANNINTNSVFKCLWAGILDFGTVWKFSTKLLLQ